MRRQKLTDQVSLQELQTMRDEGLSNREIADMLDVGYSTVCSYLPKNPNRAPYGYTKKAKPKGTLQETATGEKPPLLKCVSRIHEFEGRNMRYTVLPDMGHVTMTPINVADGQIRYKHDDLETFITELLDILSMLSGKEG